MAKQTNQKPKLLFLRKILYEQTDELHPMTIHDIIDALAVYGVASERKSLYSDLEILALYGDDIVKTKGRATHYHIGSRTFELPELKLLVDAVQSSKFITHKKSNELIGKIERLASRHEASLLQRQVYVTGRNKAVNENIYYNVDKIHSAISLDSSIRFHYFEWNLKKEPVLRHNGAEYAVSPWALSWDDENYYLIGFDEIQKKIKHYRVDKMSSITPTMTPRLGKENFEHFDMASYAKKTFGMFGGEECRVTLRCPPQYAGVLIDRFGMDIPMEPQPDGTFITRVNAAVSPQFYSWVFSLPGTTILFPKEVARDFRTMCLNAANAVSAAEER